VDRDDRSLDEARDRSARDAARYRGGLAWFGVLAAGLALAGGLAYLVYVAFSGVFDG
jgi:hypothetical protein